MTTVEQRIGASVASIEYAADVAEKFIDPARLTDIPTNKGPVKSVAQFSNEVSNRLAQVESGLVSNANDRIAQAESDLVAGADARIIQAEINLVADANARIEQAESNFESDSSRVVSEAGSRIAQAESNLNTETSRIVSVADTVISQAESNLTSESSRIISEAEAAISRIAHFQEEVFSSGSTYSVGNVYFIDSGIAYTPLIYPYVSGSSVSSDNAAGKLTIIQGITSRDIGDDIDQIATNRKIDRNIKYFEGISDLIAAVVSFPNRYIRAKTDSFYTMSECAELGISWPDGGQAAYVVTSADVLVNGYSDFLAGSKKVQLNEVNLDVRQFGVAENVSDNTERVLAAADYAYTNNVRFVTVDKNVTINPVDSALLLNNRANVMFIGDGRFSDVVSVSSALYRRQVIPKTSKTALPKTDQNLDVSLKMNPDNGVVRVVFLGDSLSTTTPNVFSPAGTKSVEFQKFIKRCNPGIEFEFIQRAIGGKNIKHLDSTPSDPNIASKYPWYTDPDREWLEYVYDVNPHLVVLASGTNDSNSFEPATLFSVVNKIESGTAANIAFITNIGAVLSGLGDRLVNTFGTRSAQEGRDYAAGYYRSFAAENGYPVIDLNRTFNMVRDGRDILSTSAITASTTTISNGIMTVGDAEDCHDFAMTVEVENGAFTNIAALSVSLSRVDTNVVFIRDNGYGRLVAIFKDGASSPVNYKTVDLNTPTPAAAYEFRCGVSGSSFFFSDKTNYENNGPVTTIPCYRFGGLFKPVIKYYNTSSGPVLSGTIAIGEPEPNMPMLTDAEMWGVVESSYQDWDIGGNGINHPSSIGAASLYQAHYAQQIMKIKSNRSESSDFQYLRLNDDGTADVCIRAVLDAPVTLIELPFPLKHASRRATVSPVGGGAYFVLVNQSLSNNTQIAVSGFSNHGGGESVSSYGFPVVLQLMGAEIY